MLGLLLLGMVTEPGVSGAVPVAQPLYYVSLGDSYAVGFQFLPAVGSTPGYTAYVAKKEHMTLENFGCAGATTSSIISSTGCSFPAASNAVSYPTQTQAAAADSFIAAHPGQVGLITVSIGGNDITGCESAADPMTCVNSADATMTTDVDNLVSGLRAAAGPGVPIMGLTYPDVVLGAWVYPHGSSNQSLASVSVTAFRTLFNPTLKAAYATVGGLFADVTAATGAYGSFSTLVHSHYGTVPLPVAEVCKLTWACKIGDIHANPKGYKVEAKLIVQTLG
jgi:lysophospholipase L1-like esterase